MILVVGGTGEAVSVIRRLSWAGYLVTATAVTHHGCSRAMEAGARGAVRGPLAAEGFLAALITQRATALVDCSHPFACEASRNAMRACREAGVPYFRFERPPLELPSNPLVQFVAGFDEAVTPATRAATGGRLFLTIGSRRLGPFVREARTRGVKLLARVLPQPDSVASCLAAGLDPGEIICCMGPFGADFEEALLRQWGVTVMVTKESGGPGGLPAKIEAAVRRGAMVFVVTRPAVRYEGPVVHTVEELLEALKGSRP